MPTPTRPALSRSRPLARGLKAKLALPALLAACSPAPDVPEDGTADATRAPVGSRAQALTPAPDVLALFDPNPSPSNGFRVVGTYRPPAWSWGEIELLEGQQRFRSEGYNRRTEKLRSQDTFQTDEYPLGKYYGALNQQLVDAFNLFYKSACATTRGAACSDPGPTRPEARFVLLHKGPKTAAKTCDLAKAPMLLVHGAMQDANVWLFPGGNDGAGNAYPGTVQKTGLVQHLEAAGRCVYALTYGNFHGDSYSQAINLANVLTRIRQIHKQADGSSPKVDVLAWSKGVLSVDAYLGNAATWRSFGSRFFDRVAAAQGAEVPAFREDVRVYVALSGPHLGIDLNFRHPLHTLVIASTPANAPIGRGPMPWTWFSALQCVNWGPDVPWYNNPYANSVCTSRGGTWPDFFNRIYVSNLTGLDTDGKPVARESLKAMNVREGVASTDFKFDEYNLSLFGSTNESGRFVTAYLGQLQAAYDLRPSYPVPRRDSSDWASLDPEESRWYPWVRPKLTYLLGGYLDDSERTACRKTAFLPSASPCVAWHTYYNSRNSDGSSGFYSKYQLMSGLGIDAAVEMGGRFIQRLAAQGLDSRLGALYVVYGEASGSPDTTFETDGMSCPTCSPNGDGVLFKKSIAGLDQLTQGWTATKKARDAKQEGVAFGHLEVGANPTVWAKIVSFLGARD